MTSAQHGFRITSNMRSFNRQSPTSTMLSFGKAESSSKTSGSISKEVDQKEESQVHKSSAEMRKSRVLSSIRSEAHVKNKAIHEKKLSVLMKGISDFKENSLLFSLTQPKFIEKLKASQVSPEEMRRSSAAKLDETQHSLRTTLSNFKSGSLRATQSTFGKYDTLVERLKHFGKERPPSSTTDEELRKSRSKFERMKLIEFTPEVLKKAVKNIDRNPKLQKWIDELESTLQKAKSQLDGIRESYRKQKIRLAQLKDQVADAGKPDSDLDKHNLEIETISKQIVAVDHDVELVSFEHEKLKYMFALRDKDNRDKKRFLSIYKDVLPEIISYLDVRQKDFENQVNSIDNTYRQIASLKKEGKYWHELATVKFAEADYEEEKDREVKRALAYEREYKEMEKERREVLRQVMEKRKAEREEENKRDFLRQLEEYREEIREYKQKEDFICVNLGLKNFKEVLRQLEKTRQTREIVTKDKKIMEEELAKKKKELEELKQKRDAHFLYNSENSLKIHAKDQLKMIELISNNSITRQTIEIRVETLNRIYGWAEVLNARINDSIFKERSAQMESKTEISDKEKWETFEEKLASAISLAKEAIQENGIGPEEIHKEYVRIKKNMTPKRMSSRSKRKSSFVKDQYIEERGNEIVRTHSFTHGLNKMDKSKFPKRLSSFNVSFNQEANSLEEASQDS